MEIICTPGKFQPKTATQYWQGLASIPLVTHDCNEPFG